MKKKTIAFYLDKEVINYLKKMAKKQDRSVSKILNKIILSLMKGGLK